MSLNFEFKQPDKTQNAVILFHGMTGSPFEMKKYGQYLYSLGYDVFACCLPGHGDDQDNIKDIKYTDWLDFAYETYETLKKEYDNVFVSGLCLGAVLALAIAEKYDDVAGVISLSTTLFLDGWRMPWYNFLTPLALTTIARFYYNFPESEPYGIKNVKTRYIIKKLLEKSEVALDNYPMTCIYELLCLSKFVRKNLYKINNPVLIIHSNEDDLTSIKSAKVVYKKISSNIKDYIVLKDSYHMVLYDNEKEFVFEKSAEFLNSCTQLKVVSAC